MEDFVLTLKKTQHGTLRGANLQPSCECLRAALDVLNVQEDSSSHLHMSGFVQTALEAVWEEIQIQDHPKRLLMLFS